MKNQTLPVLINASALAANIKSLSERPSILWVHKINLTFPHAR